MVHAALALTGSIGGRAAFLAGILPFAAGVCEAGVERLLTVAFEPCALLFKVTVPLRGAEHRGSDMTKSPGIPSPLSLSLATSCQSEPIVRSFSLSI